VVQKGDDEVPRTVTPLAISDADRRRLEEIARLRTVPLHEVRRARALLLAASGATNVEIARRCGVTPRTVAAWRRQFLEGGLDAVRWTRRGRVPPQELPAELVRLLVSGGPAPVRAHALPPAAIAGAERFPWLVRLVPHDGGLLVEWRPLVLAGLHTGAPGPAVAAAAPGALRRAPEPMTEPSHRSFLAYLKALDLRRPATSDIHVVLNRQPGHLGAYDVDRWLSHPDRGGIHVHLLPCPALWAALAERWVAAGCAALAPGPVQRARPMARTQETQ
jgi:hypothetical protein